MNAPTEKQLNVINQIELYLHVKFTGKTSKDAWNFINKYYEASLTKKANIDLDKWAKHAVERGEL